ncbi:MAG: NifB/NifX family molybdenum-iron cluster-binding protein [Gemmatimonadota bacterium]|nr:MAG: NifB/NifX family molybdenum-iron cluster-binding protein [Gemmatimonadota bacterium]
MRFCLPTLDDRGREGLLSPHFGSAPYFTIVDSGADTVEVLLNRGAHHAPGTCKAVRGLREKAIDVVICPGLGRRAFASLQSTGIAVFTTNEGDVAKALAAYQARRLTRLTAAEACQGGRHASGHCGD